MSKGKGTTSNRRWASSVFVHTLPSAFVRAYPSTSQPSASALATLTAAHTDLREAPNDLDDALSDPREALSNPNDLLTAAQRVPPRGSPLRPARRDGAVAEGRARATAEGHAGERNEEWVEAACCVACSLRHVAYSVRRVACSARYVALFIRTYSQDAVMCLVNSIIRSDRM